MVQGIQPAAGPVPSEEAERMVKSFDCFLWGPHSLVSTLPSVGSLPCSPNHSHVGASPQVVEREPLGLCVQREKLLPLSCVPTVLSNPELRRNETSLPPISCSGTGKGFPGIFTPGFPDTSADVMQGPEANFVVGRT